MYTMTVIGNLTADPTVRTVTTPHGTSTVVNFTLACKNKRMDKTFFPRITAWDEKGKAIAKYMKKGYRMMVTGEPTVSAYGANDGTMRGTQELKLEDFEFLTAHTEGAAQAIAQAAPLAAVQAVPVAKADNPVAWEAAYNDPYEVQVATPFDNDTDDDDDDLPF